MAVKKKKPTFNVMNLGFFKSVKKRWRRPRGNDNKKRIRKKFAGACPRVGYRNAREIRDIHPLGRKEMLVRNVSEVENAKQANALLRIASAVGGRKRAMMVTKAKELGLEVLNA
jgi:large subunit ribosomal protein L32e